MKDMLYAAVGLVAAVVAAWQIYAFVVQKTPKRGDSADHSHIIIGVVCAIIALICAGLFLSGKVNRAEEIHITE